jgi:hypothetical protein
MCCVLALQPVARTNDSVRAALELRTKDSDRSVRRTATMPLKLLNEERGMTNSKPTPE